MPDPIPVELVYVTDKVVWSCTIEQDRGAWMAFEFDVSKRPSYFVARFVQGNVDFSGIPRLDAHHLCIRQVSIIADAHFVRTRHKTDRLTTVPDRLAIDEYIRLLGTHMDLQLAGALIASRERWQC